MDDHTEDYFLNTTVPEEIVGISLCSSLVKNISTPPAHIDDIKRIKWVAYGIVMPILVGLGILGDILNLVVLSRPNMNAVAYMYMRGYAAASLFALLCAIPFTHLVLMKESGIWETYFGAFLYAHLVLYFGNSCLGVCVMLLLALTVERFIAVCGPLQARNLCDKKRAYLSIFIIPFITFFLFSPYPFIYEIIPCRDQRGIMVFKKIENPLIYKAKWFSIYKLLMEVAFKLVPAIILAFLNVKIIRTYRAVCERRWRMKNKSDEQRRQYAEESRLMFLLGGTSALFFFCMTPMIVLSVSIHAYSNLKGSFPFEIFRAVANVLEVTNFAVTFYIYCLFSKDFRETFLRTLKSARDKSLKASFIGSVSGLKDNLRPP